MKTTYVRAEAQLINIAEENTLFTNSTMDVGESDGCHPGYYTIPYPGGCNDCLPPIDGCYDWVESYCDNCNIDCYDWLQYVKC